MSVTFGAMTVSSDELATARSLNDLGLHDEYAEYQLNLGTYVSFDFIDCYSTFVVRVFEEVIYDWLTPLSAANRDAFQDILDCTAFVCRTYGKPVNDRPDVSLTCEVYSLFSPDSVIRYLKRFDDLDFDELTDQFPAKLEFGPDAIIDYMRALRQVFVIAEQRQDHLVLYWG